MGNLLKCTMCKHYVSDEDCGLFKSKSLLREPPKDSCINFAVDTTIAFIPESRRTEEEFKEIKSHIKIEILESEIEVEVDEKKD